MYRSWFDRKEYEDCSFSTKAVVNKPDHRHVDTLKAFH